MSLDVLNCGLGDLRLSFDPKNPVERERAARAVEDMLKRGYVIFVEHDGKLERVRSFDPKACEYIMTDVPGVSHEQAEGSPEEASPTPPPPKAKGKGKGRRVKAESVKGTSIAPRAGG